MAAHALVGAQDEIAPLVKLSLERHGVPVSDVFTVLEELTSIRFLGIATPLLEERGAREAYYKIFIALQDETFSAQNYLRLRCLLLTDEELQTIRRALKKGGPDVRLPKLAHLSDVVLFRAEDPRSLQKSGMLHVSTSPNGTFHLVFAPLDGQGFAKPKVIANAAQLKETLRRLGANFPDEIGDGKNLGWTSQLLTCSVETLYTVGLI